MSGFQHIAEALAKLERRKVITTDPEESAECCGLPRDDDGFCIYCPHHPVFVRVL